MVHFHYHYNSSRKRGTSFQQKLLVPGLVLIEKVNALFYATLNDELETLYSLLDYAKFVR